MQRKSLLTTSQVPVVKQDIRSKPSPGFFALSVGGGGVTSHFQHHGSWDLSPSWSSLEGMECLVSLALTRVWMFTRIKWKIFTADLFVMVVM